MFNFINKFKNFNFFNKNNLYIIYLHYLRYRISNAYTCYDIINIFKNISFYYKNICADELNNIIIECIKKYPLSQKEMERFSILQQQYSNTLGIDNYVTMILWTCILISIDENEK